MARPCHPIHGPDLKPLGGGCHWCDLYHTNAGYRALWDGAPAPPDSRNRLCIHIGAVVPTESQRTHYQCEKGHGVVCPCRQCKGCVDYQPESQQE